MARRKSAGPNERIEPRFDDNEPSGSDLRAPERKSASASKKKSVRKTKRSKSESGFLWRTIGWVFGKTPRLVYWSAVLGLWGFIAVLCIFGWYGAKLPNAASWEVPKRAPNVRIVGNDGALMLNRGVGGTALRLEDMSPYLPQAVIAIEDHRFHSHFGFDPVGFTRAMVTNIWNGRMRQGGSTLTQQLAKNLFLKPERTIDRKIQELIIAFWLEANYSKAEILELYLNRVYFGAGAWGVDSAARRYFGKPASAVNLQEAAMIAGLLKAPSRYSPARNPKLAKARSKTVLAAMKREGYIKSNELKGAKGPIITTGYYRSGPEHFIGDMVMRDVKKLIGEVRSDVTVETTISPYLLTAAQGVIQASLDKNAKSKKVAQAALVSLAPDGAIRALIGGRNYQKSQFNRATDAKRQPGSAFKTFVWMAAVERGIQPETILIDEPIQIGSWRPENYDRRFRGEVSVRDAFASSLNTIAVKLVNRSGPRHVAATARRMGISSKLSKNASIALGTSEVSLMELTAAYAPFSNGGLQAKPYLITKITSVEGKVLYKRGKRPAIRVVKSRTLGKMNAMLHRVLTKGTGKAAQIKNHFGGGKTGTSQNSRDAWFVGHTAHLATGIWFGNDDNSPTKKLTGGSLPAKAWGKYMSAAHQGLPSKILPGQGFLVAALSEDMPVPRSRPRQRGEPLQQVAQGQSVVRRVGEKAKKTILDLLFNN